MKSALVRRAATAVLAVALAACGSASGRTTEPAARPSTTTTPVTPGLEPIAHGKATLPATVTGADGKTVTVTDTSRIVPLSGGIAEVLFALGLGDSVVGRDVTTRFPEAADLPVVTHGHQLNIEGMLALRPTLVIGDGRSGPPQALDQLRAAGLPVVLAAEATDIAGIRPRVEVVARAVGLRAAGVRLADRIERDIAEVTERTGARPWRVAFLYVRGGPGVYLLGGKGSGADAVLSAAGARDVGAAVSDRPFTPLTAEAMVSAAPDVLLVMTEGLESVGGIDGLVALTGVAQTPAGKARRVVEVDDGLLLGFGPRTPTAVAEVAAALDRFRS